jgi:hypothetical protein
MHTIRRSSEFLKEKLQEKKKISHASALRQFAICQLPFSFAALARWVLS